MKSLRNILFLDIETVPEQPNFSELSERKQLLWDKKSTQWRKENTAEEAYERAGIYAEFGKTICISVGSIVDNVLHIKSFYGDNEKEILEKFKVSLQKFARQENPLLCAHNGKEFDYPYLCRRMLINGIKLPRLLQIQNKKPWEIPLLDTLDLWRFGDYKNYTSLDLLCEIFEIPTPKSDIDGSQVSGIYWQEQNLERIVKYCEADVVALTQLYLRMHGFALLSEEAVSFVE
ncbi:MAG: 3'-5' exonuclease [Flavobacteriaceae bacterium]|nr:3'-5' exonuclease [Flavobacteriaceae bacterium]